MKVDVAIQSYNKPESLIYTLLSLKKHCGDYIDTIYIDDDKSEVNTVEFYKNTKLINLLSPIKIKIRINKKKSGFTHTCMTRTAFKKKSILNKIQLLGHKFINRIQFYETSDDIRYQWGINSTDKKYIFLIHDDIKFYDNVLALYLESMLRNDNLAIVGDLGGSKRCEFGPCETGFCSPKRIMEGYRPTKNWPITGKAKSFVHSLLGRKSRHCRINEWCCLIDVQKCRHIEDKYGVFFGNYEGGGDVGTYWFDIAINKENFDFLDPLPSKELRNKYYLHWWQGYEGHSVWVNSKGDKNLYNKELIIDCLYKDFGYKFI